ncbi:MAG: FAD:protein FMN transferase [Gaiellales bacterium]
MTDRFDCMGCRIEVAGATPDELGAVRCSFSEYDRTFSRVVPASELNRVNRAAGRVVELSPLFAGVLRRALEMAEETSGLVDPTLGAAIEAAGYDRDFAALNADERAPGRPAPGRWRELQLHGRLLRAPAGVLLDLNGVVKGLAADAALARLTGPGWVSAGGDLVASAPVDVELPGGESVRLVTGGLATSGSARRRWLRGGRECHHLIDPATGAPAVSPWEQVTASGVCCLAADVAAKAAFLLGGTGPGWLDARGIPGRFVRSDGTVHENRAWAGGLAGAAACT